MHEVNFALDIPQIKIEPSELVEKVRQLSKEYDMLEMVTAIDWLKDVDPRGYTTPTEAKKGSLQFRDRFELLYLFRNTKTNAAVLLRVEIQRENPEIESLCSFFKSAEWQEDEVYDLFGIKFKNHPFLRRILLWNEFDGYPLRKDYIHKKDELD
ncbi:MAG: NADH-quinone oxidoreductase subunit C [bacterium]|nr:NADH-quinone oxidoreductase subunit C [bacterium]